MAETELCRLCGRDKAWHDDNQPQHAFVDYDGNKFVMRGDKASPRAAKADAPGNPPARDAAISRELQRSADPVLRGLLVYKGVITPEELTEFQQTILGGLSETGAVVFGPGLVSPGVRRDNGGDEGGGQPGSDRSDDRPGGNGADPG